MKQIGRGAAATHGLVFLGIMGWITSSVVAEDLLPLENDDQKLGAGLVIAGGLLVGFGGDDFALYALHKISKSRLLKSTKFDTTEKSVIAKADDILNDPEFDKLRRAFADGEVAEVNIKGTTIVFEPDYPGSGMTLFNEGGFVMGRHAFSSEGETVRTVLHESHRLATSQQAGGVTQKTATSETRAAERFADEAAEFLGF